MGLRGAIASSNRAARSSQLSPSVDAMVTAGGAVMGGLGDSTNGLASSKDRARGINACVCGPALLVPSNPDDAWRRGTSAGVDGPVYRRVDRPESPWSEVSIGGSSGDR